MDVSWYLLEHSKIKRLKKNTLALCGLLNSSSLKKDFAHKDALQNIKALELQTFYGYWTN